MSWTRNAMAAAFVLMLTAARALSQTGPQQPDPSPPEAKDWSFSASAYTYFVPHSQAYVNPNFTADHHKLHLEARYNYEAMRTGSAWIGYNLSYGKKLSVEVTPMIGAVFGKLKGIAPGYLAAITFKKFDLSSQGEFVFANDRTNDFFYSWDELGYTPAEWFRGGLVVQRTKAYQTPLDIQRGLFAGVTYKKIQFVTYVFNLDKHEKTVVPTVVVSF